MRPIYWSNPINWQHPLNRDLVRWWLSVPHFANKDVLYDLTKRNHGVLNNMESADVAAGPGGMNHIEFGGTDEYMGGVIPSGFGFPFTMAAVARSASLTDSTTIMSINQSDASNKYTEIRFVGNVANDPIRAISRFGLATKIATTTVPYLINTWHLVMGTFISVADRTIYLDGTNRVNNADSIVTEPTWDTIDVGRLGSSSPVHGTCDIASSAVWSRALTSVEASEYYRQYIHGFSDLLRSVRRRPIYSAA